MQRGTGLSLDVLLGSRPASQPLVAVLSLAVRLGVPIKLLDRVLRLVHANARSVGPAVTTPTATRLDTAAVGAHLHPVLRRDPGLQVIAVAMDILLRALLPVLVKTHLAVRFYSIQFMI